VYCWGSDWFRFNNNVVDGMTTIVAEAIEGLLFGSAWYFGILIFIIMSLAIMKMWKYAGALIIPFIIALEVQYYNRLSETNEFAWPMIALLMLAVGMAVYMVTGREKD